MWFLVESNRRKLDKVKFYNEFACSKGMLKRRLLRWTSAVDEETARGECLCKGRRDEMCHPRRGRVRASTRTVRSDHAKKHTRLRGAVAQAFRRQVQPCRHREEITLCHLIATILFLFISSFFFHHHHHFSYFLFCSFFFLFNNKQNITTNKQTIFYIVLFLTPASVRYFSSIVNRRRHEIKNF